MQNKKEIKLTETDLKAIYGPDYNFFQEKILSNCFCHRCRVKSYTAMITKYKIFLNDLNDIVLRGVCAACGGPVNRYLETGEVESYLPRIKKVKQKYAN